MLKHVPNILTIIRFILIPFIVISLFTGQYILAFIIITLSGFTDVADGFIARKFNLITNFGKLMDPLADKLTQISILATLTIKGIIPILILIIVVIKEFVIVAGAAFLYGKNVVVYSRWYGKAATVLFYLAIVISIFTEIFKFPEPWTSVYLIIYYLALAMTIIALILYTRNLSKLGFINKEDLKKDVQDVKKKKTEKI